MLGVYANKNVLFVLTTFMFRLVFLDHHLSSLHLIVVLPYLLSTRTQSNHFHSNSDILIAARVPADSVVRRGRPRTGKKKPPKPYNSDEILLGPCYPLELVTTKVGGMKAAYDNYCYEFHFNRLGNKFWRCIAHPSGCGAKIMSRDNLMYVINAQHNHDNDSIVFVSTSKLVAGGQPTTAPPETNIVSMATDLKSKLKQRFAALKEQQ